MLLFYSLLLSQFFANSLSKNTVETLDLEKYQYFNMLFFNSV